MTGKFWNSVMARCRFRNAAEIEKLRALVEQQLAHAASCENDPSGHNGRREITDGEVVMRPDAAMRGVM